jgi:hypothetical protein
MTTERFIRPIRGWWRFSARHRADVQFDRYLDARVSGETSPEVTGMSLPAECRDRLQELTGAAQQVFALDAAAGASRMETLDDKDAIWRTMMDAMPVAGSTGKYAALRTQTMRLPEPEMPGRWWRQPVGMLSPLLSMVLVLAIVGGLAYGVVDRNGWFGDTGGGDDPPRMLTATGTPESTADLAGTPVSSAIDLPTADDCTVEPLTVDEVMGILGNNYDYLATQLEGPYASPEPAVPYYTTTARIAPTQETVDAIAETQRQWVACVLADDWFRVWALMSPKTIQYQVRILVFPTYFSEDQGRELLEELKEGTAETYLKTPRQRYYEPTRNITLVDTNPDHSVQMSPQLIAMSTIWYDAAGHISQPSVFYADVTSQYTYYSWDSFRGRWVLGA